MEPFSILSVLITTIPECMGTIYISQQATFQGLELPFKGHEDNRIRNLVRYIIAFLMLSAFYIAVGNYIIDFMTATIMKIGSTFFTLWLTYNSRFLFNNGTGIKNRLRGFATSLALSFAQTVVIYFVLITSEAITVLSALYICRLSNLYDIYKPENFHILAWLTLPDRAWQFYLISATWNFHEMKKLKKYAIAPFMFWTIVAIIVYIEINTAANFYIVFDHLNNASKISNSIACFLFLVLDFLIFRFYIAVIRKVHELSDKIEEQGDKIGNLETQIRNIINELTKRGEDK